MATAFQANAFQNNAFQIDTGGGAVFMFAYYPIEEKHPLYPVPTAENQVR